MRRLALVVILLLAFPLSAQFGTPRRLEAASAAAFQTTPRGCAGAGVFLVLWVEQTDTRVVAFQPLSADGVPIRAVQTLHQIGDVPTPPSLDAPVCAFDGANFLIVWAELPVSDVAYAYDPTYVYGVRVSPSGQLLGSPFLIYSVTRRMLQPRLVWNGEHYFLVTVNDAPEIRRITAAGAVVDPQPLRISGFPDADPILGWDGSQFVALARRYSCPPSTCVTPAWSHSVSRLDRNLALIGQPQVVNIAGSGASPLGELAVGSGSVLAAMQNGSAYSALQIAPQIGPTLNDATSATPHIAWNGASFVIAAGASVRVGGPSSIPIPASSVGESVPLAMESGRVLLMYVVGQEANQRIEYRSMSLLASRRRAAH